MVDSHCHLDEPAYEADCDEVISRQMANGVTAVVIPGVDKSSIDAIFAVCRRWRGFCYPVLGLHPQNVLEDWQEQIALLREAIYAHAKPELDISERIVAIGEIGLDYHYTREFEEAQHQVLLTQLQWAHELHLPVIIHSRDATADSLELIGNFVRTYFRQGDSALAPEAPGVIHCFSGSREVADQWLDMGFYLGIGGVLTFKNSKLAENIAHVPLERLLLETDGPYLAPTPHRGERNEPWMIRFVAERLAELHRCTPQEVMKITADNARKLFRLGE